MVLEMWTHLHQGIEHHIFWLELRSLLLILHLRHHDRGYVIVPTTSVAIASEKDQKGIHHMLPFTLTNTKHNLTHNAALI